MRRWRRNPADWERITALMGFIDSEASKLAFADGAPQEEDMYAQRATDYLLKKVADDSGPLPSRTTLRQKMRGEEGRVRSLEYAQAAAQMHFAEFGTFPEDDYALVEYMVESHPDWAPTLVDFPEKRVELLRKGRQKQAELIALRRPEAYELDVMGEEGEMRREAVAAAPSIWSEGADLIGEERMIAAERKMEVVDVFPAMLRGYYEAYAQRNIRDAVVYFIFLQRMGPTSIPFAKLHRHLTTQGLPLPKRARAEGIPPIGRLSISLAQVKKAPEIAYARIMESME